MKPEIPQPPALKRLPPDGGPDFNRLVFEKSPYLLQHAANPVDWYPWSESAFAQARRQDKPIFLSIGYATCHWCHVMAEESFEDPQTAALINQHFIPVKVDREERPDIDRIYMAVCQAITGTGGWPLTALLTWERKPFFVGTYFPRETRYGRTGLLDLIPRVAELWANNRGELLESAESITAHLLDAGQFQSGQLEPGLAQRAFRQLEGRFDEIQGGFGAAPKFPSPHTLGFLLHFWKAHDEPRALEMVEKTLLKMRLGSIFDQVGFGFHRYSTDAAWRLPHFEKMLYDQAMLAIAYTKAYLATGKEFYARVVREVLSYVLRDLAAPDGGFYSAEDADSEGEEGLFYQWTAAEFRKIADEHQAGELFQSIFNLQAEGNYLEEGTRQLTGRNLLYLANPLETFAGEAGLTSAELADKWETLRQALFEARERRVHPFKDDKILTDWNGLAIAALAIAAAALDEPSYLQAAVRAADFVWKELRSDDGRLLKRYREGDAAFAAHLDDYAFLAWGMLELYQAGFQAEHLRRALALVETMLAEFWDEQQGGFFFSAAGQVDLIQRGKEIYDGALPSGNSVAFDLLTRLGRLLSRPDLEEKALMIAEVFSSQVNQVPQGYTHLMSGLLQAQRPSREVVIAGNPADPGTQMMLRRVQGTYDPGLVVHLRPSGGGEPLFRLAPILREQIPLEGKATAYVCRDYHCSSPTTDLEQLDRLLRGISPTNP